MHFYVHSVDFHTLLSIAQLCFSKGINGGDKLYVWGWYFLQILQRFIYFSGGLAPTTSADPASRSGSFPTKQIAGLVIRATRFPTSPFLSFHSFGWLWLKKKKRGEREAAERWGSDTNNRPASRRPSAACDEINSAHKGSASAAFCAPLRHWQRLISLVLHWGAWGGWFGGEVPLCGGTGSRVPAPSGTYRVSQSRLM